MRIAKNESPDSAQKNSQKKRLKQKTPVAPNLTVYTLQQMVGNARVSQLIQREEIKSAIGYMGLNPKAYEELNALKRYSKDIVIGSLDDAVKEKMYQTTEDMVAFVYRGLGISPFNTTRFVNALLCLFACDTAFREQMADMMQMFHAAESGQFKLERLVLSGHHSGGEMWGETADDELLSSFVPERDLTNLAKTFPKAAAQIQDVMFSACNTKEQVELCQRLFPNLQSVWAYEGFSPRIDQGSARHIKKWEKTTRDEHVPAKKDEMGNTLVWSRKDDFLVEFE
jgi:hypothetical protein